MAKWQIELQDGRKFEVEADTQPTEQDVMSSLSRGATGSFGPDDRFEGFGQQVLENLKGAGQETLGSAKEIANVGAFGIPEILSQKIAGKPFVPEDLKHEIPGSEMGNQMLGYTLGPKALTNLATKGTRAALSRVSSSGIPGIMKAATTGAVSGAVGYGSQLPSPEEAKTLEEAINIIAGRAKTGAIIGGVLAGAGQTYSQIRNYGPAKVKAVRAKWKTHTNKQYDKFGKRIESLPAEPIDGARVVGKLEMKLEAKGLLNPDGSFNKPRTTAESKLIKAYQRIYNKWASAKGGKLTSKDIISEYKEIKGRYSNTNANRELRDTADDFLDASKDQFKSGAWEKAKADYSTFKDQEDVMQRYFRVKSKSLYPTKKGEQFISKGLTGSKDSEAEAVKRIVLETTGESLSGGIALTKINQILKHPITRFTLAASGLLGAAYRIFGGEK